MNTYLISDGEYSDYGVWCIVQAENLTEDDLHKYHLEATRRYAIHDDKRLEAIANFLGVQRQSCNYNYRILVGAGEFEKAMKVIGWDSPDFFEQVLVENGIVILEFTEYNIGDYKEK